MSKFNPTLIVSGVMLCAVILSGCTSTFTNQSSPVSSTVPAAQGDPQTLKPYTLVEIAQHATKEDCWMAIEGKVYDVTQAIAAHPGGDDILAGCGKDATSLFNARPGEHNTPHSAKTAAMLTQFEIGTLQTE